jgi:lysyl-tRNA synthetase class 2
MEEDRIDYERRLEMLRELREMGVDPYPHKYPVSHTIKEVVERGDEMMGEEVAVAGRLQSLRIHGGLTFGDIKEDGYRVQGFFKKDVLGPEKYIFLKKFVGRGDFIWVKGEVTRTKKGELSVLAKEFAILSKALYGLPHEWFGVENVEVRYRKRYLDLMLNPEVFELFRKRALALREIRRFLCDRGFLEMETPVLQPVYGGANAKPFKTHVNAIGRDYYLRISPELYLKRLLVGGYTKVFELSKNFRNEDIDTRHNPEFTMLEIYQAYADYEDMMRLTEELIVHVAREVYGTTEVTFRGEVVDLTPPFRRIRMWDALREVGANPESVSDEELQRMLEERGIELPGGYSRGLALAKLFEDEWEEKLIQPTFVMDYPQETTPLCKPHRSEPGLVERFELYIGGLEVANGYSELNDPLLQEALFREQAARRKMGDVEAHQYDADFVEALRWGMPPAGGVGIGIDRLIMVLSGKDSIKEVILYPMLAPRG